ncbi:MAG: hypothetical protein SGJ10_03505 [Bacteroidota bacterium]|nr:hypothetical protein [Bacteroidota bacterium]
MKNYLCGLIDTAKNQILPLEYNEIKRLGLISNIVMLEKERKWGLYSFEQGLILPIKYNLRFCEIKMTNYKHYFLEASEITNHNTLTDTTGKLYTFKKTLHHNSGKYNTNS